MIKVVTNGLVDARLTHGLPSADAQVGGPWVTHISVNSVSLSVQKLVARKAKILMQAINKFKGCVIFFNSHCGMLVISINHFVSEIHQGYQD